jgi:hypothetical protein
MFALYEVPGTNTRSHPAASSSARRPSAVSDADISVRTEVVHPLEQPGTFPREIRGQAPVARDQPLARSCAPVSYLFTASSPPTEGNPSGR